MIFILPHCFYRLISQVAFEGFDRGHGPSQVYTLFSDDGVPLLKLRNGRLFPTITLSAVVC